MADHDDDYRELLTKARDALYELLRATDEALPATDVRRAYGAIRDQLAEECCEQRDCGQGELDGPIADLDRAFHADDRGAER